MADPTLAKRLLDCYVWHKRELVRKAGMEDVFNEERLRDLARPRIERMAEVVENWDVHPDLIMDAVFAKARRNRHPDGPMPNMLQSVKYITGAVSEFLMIPYEAVMARRGMETLYARYDSEFESTARELDRIGVTDLSTASSYPVAFRYLMAVNRLDWEDAFFMAQELLRNMEEDRSAAAWLRHRGITYEAVAAMFNKIKPKNG